MKIEAFDPSKVEIKFSSYGADFYNLVLNGRFIGGISFSKDDDKSKPVYIANFHVDAKYRGMGLGTKLLEYGIIDCRNRRGIKSFSLTADPKDERTKHIYKKLGFVTKDSRGAYHTLGLELQQ